jgi:hypothetical protein
MTIRELTNTDINVLYEIWKKHYSEEFTFPNFSDHFLNAFVVEDNDRIITGGGVRLIAESILITNKDIGKLTRRDALIMTLQASQFFCKKNGFNQLHAFVQDEKWQDILEQYDFRPTVGNALVIDI